MRNSMMDAVISLLDHVSPDKVSIRMIAEKVGVSHMVFYTYFKDRDEIMQVLIERERKRINDHFAAKLEKAKTASAKSVMQELISEYMQTAEEHPKIFRLFWLDPMIEENQEHARFNQLDDAIASLSKLIKIGIEKGEFNKRNERLAATTIMAIINGPIVMEQCKKLPADIKCAKLMEQITLAAFSYLQS
jgi:AcrR family transcriptional regulator